MMNGGELRDAILVALRRDLVGPIFDPTGSYPGSRPKPIHPRTMFAHLNDASGTFVADDGEEVVKFRPTARYGVGVLYPSMNHEVEEKLDLDQLHEAEVPNEEEPFAPPRPSANVALDDVVDVPLEPDEVRDNRIERPSSMAVSFVVALKTILRVTITGATYEPFPVLIAGEAKSWWHRVPLPETTVHFDLPISMERSVLPLQTAEVGTLRLVLGVIAHRMQPGDLNRIVTCYVRNNSKVDDPALIAAQSLFQSQLRIGVPQDALCDYRQSLDMVGVADDDASFALLYANHPVKAIGHGCDASFEIDEQSGTATVMTESLPVARIPITSVDVPDRNGKPIEIGMAALGDWSDEALSGVELLLDGYKAWIEMQETLLSGIPSKLHQVARRHLAGCRNFLQDIREGWDLANSDLDVKQCLRWTSQAMADQQIAYRAKTRSIITEQKRIVRIEGVEPRSDGAASPTWRPFQIAFLLANLAPSVDVTHPRRRDVDVIWMPTGGGKTEAYLALAAFTMLWRRSSTGGVAEGTAVIMRYTLRLLTAQQMQRTASLICALELLRCQHRDLLGKKRFSVGAWLGATSTPNRRDDAIIQLNRYLDNTGERPFLLTRCPWCAVDMTNGQVFGYRRQPLRTGGARVQAHCPNPACEFNIVNGPSGLPVYEVDEDLYENPPTFLLGTVDKFAMLAWQERARVFFGLDKLGNRQNPAPDLVIQDELHLITGPLGSLVGLYEGALTNLCEHDGGCPPRVVAATATTRAYERQVRLLFNASGVRLVPPAGLSMKDGYFAHQDFSVPQRTFVGICSAGLGSFTHVEARVLASLAQAAGALEDESGDSVDFYWTNLVFFGSLRDLGLSKSLISTDLRGYQYSLSQATGVRSGEKRNDGIRLAVRYLTDTELTSASSQLASDALARLQKPRKEPGSVDLALATSVIEVGVDVPRLGLLTVVRQPKTAATYIQVAGRVGRTTKEGPGLVVVLLDPRRGRDLSHYERFTAYHQRLFAAVEAASVTPFTVAALERGLRGVISAVVRQTRPYGQPAVNAGDIDRAVAAADYLSARAISLDSKTQMADEWEIARNELGVAEGAMIRWGDAGPATEAQFLRRPEVPAPVNFPSWVAPTSLRSVDNNGGLRIDPSWLPPVGSPAALGAAALHEGGDEW